MKHLDLEKIIKSKSPKLARFIPRFVVRWMEKLVAADRHNEILDLYGDRTSIGFIDGALEYIGVDYELHSVENLPENSRLVFAANHPLGGVDGMILATAIERIRPDVRLIVNDILLNIEPLRPIFVGINKHGRQGADSARAMDELYASNHPIINFPAGLCSRLIRRGVIDDLPWKRSFVVRSINSDRTVIPTYVDARNSKFFYRFGYIRKKLGIKTNLDMMLLPGEVFHQKGKTVHIYFGQPITLDSNHTPQQWCDLIREKVYQMAKNKK